MGRGRLGHSLIDWGSRAKVASVSILVDGYQIGAARTKQ